MTPSRLVRFSLPLAIAAGCITAAAQANPPAKPQTNQPSAPQAAPTVGSAVGAITLPVTVVDDKGNPVKNLKADDLKLTDNGAEQKIQSFGPAAPTPMNFAIVAQTTPGLKTELGDMRLASVRFVDHTLPAGQDNFLVIQYATEVDLLVDPTRAQDKLHDAMNQLGSPQFGGAADESDYHWGGTLYDAIYLAAQEELKKQSGQHVLVLISDGVDRGSKESMSDAVQAAQEARTAIFAIYYPTEERREAPQRQNAGNQRRGGINFPGGGSEYPGTGGGGGSDRRGEQPRQSHEDGKTNLEHICSATSGYMIEGRHDKADEAYNKLANLLKNQYTLTFVPTSDAAASAFHRMTLTTQKKGVYPLMQQGFSPQQ